jgi:acyl-CoA reductase-like NAD-dependent aldehyde dehydrogenase
MRSVVRIVSPIDSEVYAERAVASEAAVARAVAAARAAQRAWARRPLEP